jgi:hypothetical protein
MQIYLRVRYRPILERVVQGYFYVAISNTDQFNCLVIYTVCGCTYLSIGVDRTTMVMGKDR